MDVNKMADDYFKLVEVGRKFDTTSSAGVYWLSDGEITTEENLHMELCMFVLHVLGENSNLDAGKLSLLNYAYGEKHDAAFYRHLRSRTGTFRPDECITLRGIAQADKILTENSGCRSTTFADLTISVFEAFGSLAMCLEDSTDAAVRNLRYIRGLKDYVSRNI